MLDVLNSVRQLCSWASFALMRLARTSSLNFHPADHYFSSCAHPWQHMQTEEYNGLHSATATAATHGRREHVGGSVRALHQQFGHEGRP